jgi:hypothetical protein
LDSQDQNNVFGKLPAYFKSHTPEDLKDLVKSPYAYAQGLEGLSYYQVISENPDRLKMFNLGISQIEKVVSSRGVFPWDAQEAKIRAEPERPFIVDIGGGMGQMLNTIQEVAPGGFGGQMILQDRREVLDAIPDESIPNVTKMEYDFFKPQTVKSRFCPAPSKHPTDHR